MSSQEALEILAEIDDRIHFATQQNDVPVVRRIRVVNRTGEILRDLTLRLAAEPEFALPWTVRIARLDPGSTFQADAVDVKLSPRFLAGQTERVRGRLLAEVVSGEDEQEEILASRNLDVELLARDEWAGLSSLPEMLAAFVLPNHPAIEDLLGAAAGVLEEWTGDPSLSGYQSRDPKRVLSTAAAIYAVLQKTAIVYAEPPASFELEGQRVRLPDRLLSARLGTCLDLTLLAAACLEQAGLHPLLILVRGHAFVGVWLQEECFPDAAADDAARLRKRVDLDEIALFDVTGATARPPIDFERTVEQARRRIDPGADGEEPLHCVIDVRRARRSRILPLPENIDPDFFDDLDDEERAEPQTLKSVPDAPDVSRFDRPAPAAAPATASPPEKPATRLDRWRRRLLDLSLRNRLLNFRETKKTLPLLAPDLNRLEDLIAEGKKFQLRPRPKDFSDEDPRDAEAARRRTGEGALDELLQTELETGRLCGDVDGKELERRQIEIYRAARLGLEEGGASALFLAIGFLVWYESEHSEKPRLAPILLLPLEAQRKSIQEGVRVQAGDEEPRINVTLLEMLRQDFGLEIDGLDPLPEDEQGVDVAQVLRIVRTAVREVDRWDVRESAAIGLFSFHKFLMWRDLSERADALLKSPVVEHLVQRPDQPYDPDGTFLAPERLDDERSPDQTFCPLSADSSQLAAIFAAAEGRSFVLEGPPGTGKSQTITNLIAHCLAEEKTVLFVSEKMAALNVVHKRLVDVGLARYCLELHSNKSHKREVVAQLERALERVDAPADHDWRREAQDLAALRSDLNEWVRAMHRPRKFGRTVFQATSSLVGFQGVPLVELPRPSIDEFDRADFDRLSDLVERLATAGRACDEVRSHPFAAAGRSAWSNAWEGDVRKALAALGRCVDPLSESVAEAAKGAGVEVDQEASLGELRRLDEVCRLLLEDEPAPSPALLADADGEERRAALDVWIEHGRRRDALRAELRERFRDDVVDLDLEGLRNRLTRAESAWVGVAWFHRFLVRYALGKTALEGQKPNDEQAAQAIATALEQRAEQEVLDAAADDARTLLGKLWNDGEADWEMLARMSRRVARLRALATRMIRVDIDEDPLADLARAAQLRERWARLLGEGRDLLREGGALAVPFSKLTAALAGFEEARGDLVEVLDLDEEKAWPAEEASGLARVRERLARWNAETSKLRDWCAWRRVRDEAVADGLLPLIAGYEQGSFESPLLKHVFERGVTRWWLSRVTDAEPVLNGFFSPELERKIDLFRDVDARYADLTSRLIQARLAARVPKTSDALPNSETGVLLREIGKKRRHLPVRRLLKKIPNLLPRIKPCLLMSPMSVAQYLGGDAPPFDLVVFDEASQIPVWDAIGALGRGRQAVVVGDPKQLPPTSFFQREEVEGEAEDDLVEDLESILDDCLAAQIPWMPLDWHYRSRHESLIAFSNYHYYRNRLLTFPSPTLTGMGVSLRPVPDGVYDKGKSRTNRAEAREVTAEIVRRLRDPSQRNSIGVVTFSQAQQTLIEDLLDAERRKDPEIDRLIAEETDEPIFVKNLENVQGDERDVIFFSIGYGPDARGKVSMNFGPMNRDGGERRLNVAITRARREVTVFSTLKSEQIDLSRTRARGVADLKHFLEYAEHGPSVLGTESVFDEEAGFDSPFEEAVYEALVSQGHAVHKQVGCARYRIDLGVVDPESPGRYLLGVECDGANYHRAKTARDRDKLRESVLRGLGWTLHRIWSTDWLADPKRQAEKLEEAIRQAEIRRDREPALIRVEPPTPVELPAADQASEESTSEEIKRTIDDIPAREIREAAAELLKENLSAPREELAIGTARRLGFARRGRKIGEAVDRAIDDLAQQGSINMSEDGTVTWTDEA